MEKKVERLGYDSTSNLLGTAITFIPRRQRPWELKLGA